MAKEFLLALDAGHGLTTPGKRCLKAIDPKETREWVLNDRVCRYIAERAAMYEGFKTMRVDDPTGKTDVSRQERCRRANNAGADLYLSDHHNAGIRGGSGGGVVAFCMRGGVAAKQWRDELYAAIIAAGGLKGNRSNPTQEKNFDVLVQSRMPAVLIEYGFMDSTADVPVILTEEYAKTVGYAVADCIAAREGMKLIGFVGFADVTESAWYADAVRWAVRKCITKGADDNNFKPDDICTRGQAVTFLHRLYDTPEADGVYIPFADVDPAAYYAKAVQWAVQHGITLGTGDNRFCPDEPCTRGQIVTMLWRAAGEPEGVFEYTPFDDVKPDSYYAEAVNWAYSTGIASGVGANRFCPDEGCTRAEMVTFLHRMNTTI